VQEVSDSITYFQRYHYTIGTNLLVRQDTLLLVHLPATGLMDTLLQGDTVVVVEFLTDTVAVKDTVWVKLMTGFGREGWIVESEVDDALMPINLISLCIQLFSTFHNQLFACLLLLFLLYLLFRRFSVRRKSRWLLFRDSGMDILYPVALFFLTAFCAAMYESLQLFASETWEHFYFNPTLNPLAVPLSLAAFLVGIWLYIIVFIAAAEEAYRHLPLREALFRVAAYLVGCILCYLFFVWAVQVRVGYVLLPLFLFYFLRRLRIAGRTPVYRCGQCGAFLRRKGRCRHCGTLNT
jgi:hypothetical protein